MTQLSIPHLKAQALLARRLARHSTDRMAVHELELYAAECDALVDTMEAAYRLGAKPN